jgi:hypothetical protein
VGPEDVTTGDLNGDARPDAVVSHWDSGSVAVYLNVTGAAPDLDDDGITDAADCAPASRVAWALPSAIFDLLLDGADTALTWSAPGRQGTSVPRYDVLRAPGPAAFQEAQCVASDVSSRFATDLDAPEPGASFFYLVRTRNACGENLGTASDDVPRVGRSCPDGS